MVLSGQNWDGRQPDMPDKKGYITVDGGIDIGCAEMAAVGPVVYTVAEIHSMVTSVLDEKQKRNLKAGKMFVKLVYSPA